MSAPASLPRPLVGGLALGLIAAVLLVDLLRAPAVDPFRAPPPAALGSGLGPSAAHCAVAP